LCGSNRAAVSPGVRLLQRFFEPGWGKMGNILPDLEKASMNSTDLPEEQGAPIFIEGVGPTMRAVEEIIRELAQSDVPVLILAERGAGKHATAQRIHAMSRRTARPFRALTCSTLMPEELTSSIGKRETSTEKGETWLNGGTIFLEELADLSLDCQAHLLRALPRIEDNDSMPTDRARLVCGSARDLEVEVKAGRVREDIYYRINSVCLHLPPLRQRKEDIPFLMDHFLRKYARDFRRSIPSLSAEAQQLFQDYAWPGNLRELEDAAKALVVRGNETVAVAGLRALFPKPHPGSNGDRVSLKQAARAASRAVEKELILKVLTRTRWNRRRAAEELQISYKALLYKLKQIGCTEYGVPSSPEKV
jgi:two-component system response regulator AtoC